MGTYVRFLGRQLFIWPPALPVSLSLTSRVGIVTGSNIGLGLHACRQLLAHHLSFLILAVRSEEKGLAARTELLSAYPDAEVEVWVLDLDDYASVVAFVERCKTLPRIDFAVLNAAVMKEELELNVQTGNEVTLQTNWLSTALLALLLIPVLEASLAPSPHLSFVVSETGEWAGFPERRSPRIIAALNEGKDYDSDERYCTSKLMLMYFFRELVDRTAATSVVINAVNPGFCWGSALHREVPGVGAYVLGGMKRVVGRSPEVGARTLVDGAVGKGPESHGRYLEDSKVKGFWPLFNSEDSRQTQERLWNEMMEELSPVADLSRYAAKT